jgi:uncharacterized protein YuzE
MLKHAKFSYDKETDKVYFSLGEGPAVDSIQVNENIRVEFDEEGNIIGMLLLMVMSPIIPSLECHIFGLFL